MANKDTKGAKAPEGVVSQTVVPGASASASFEQNLRDTKAQLDKQPKKTIRLRAAGKDELNFETCCINGYIFQIMRGVEVEVPQTVYDILDEAHVI